MFFMGLVHLETKNTTNKTWQNLGPLLKVWLLVGYIEKNTKLKRSQVLREHVRSAVKS